MYGMEDRLMGKVEKLEAENAKLRARIRLHVLEKDALGSALLDVQQDCIKLRIENTELLKSISTLRTKA